MRWEPLEDSEYRNDRTRLTFLDSRSGSREVTQEVIETIQMREDSRLSQAGSMEVMSHESILGILYIFSKFIYQFGGGGGSGVLGRERENPK